MALLDIYNVERIEVLRGPQGTLYGRNTIGGAVKYVTRRLADVPEAELRANFGTYKQFDLVMSASTPLGGGGFKVGAALARLSRDGFGKNLTTGEENYNKEVFGASAVRLSSSRPTTSSSDWRVTIPGTIAIRAGAIVYSRAC